jgi:hypothetical protein
MTTTRSPNCFRLLRKSTFLRSLLLFGAALLVAAVGPSSAALAQKGGKGGGTCTNIPLEFIFDDEGGDRIFSDGRGGYTREGILWVCGTHDATLNLDSSGKKDRKIGYQFPPPVSVLEEGYPSWIDAGDVHYRGTFVNIRRLGLIREEGAPTYTLAAVGLDGPDGKRYTLRFTPEGVDPWEIDPHPVSNSPYETSPVVATFYEGSGNAPDPNPYGLWVVSGRELSPDGYLQLGTLLRQERNGSLTHQGQYEMPFGLVVRALAPLPPLD